MRLYATYYSSVGRNEDYGLTLGNESLLTFTVAINGMTVQVEADFLPASTFVWDIAEPNVEVPHPARVNGFRAVLCTDEITELTLDISRQCRRTAFEVLQRVMVHLRDVTDDPLIDVYLSTFHIEGFELWGSQKHPIDLGSRDHELHLSKHTLTADDWQQATDRVCSNASVLLRRDLVLAARSFLDARNYNMALMNAAIACEMLLHQLINWKLMRAKIIGYKAPQDMSNPERVDIALKHKLINTSQARELAQIFRDRNGIVHWRNTGSISPEKADLAVQMAQRLETLLIVA